MKTDNLNQEKQILETSSETPFQRLKFRHLILMALLALSASYAIAYFLNYLNINYEIAWHIAQLSMWVTLLCLVVWHLKVAGTDFGRLFGRIVDFDLWLVCKATFFLYLFSIGTSFLMIYLALHLTPSLVETWSGSYDRGMDASFPLIIVPLIVGAFLVPVTEEIVVRGAILHRFAVKWGIGISLILSSLIFAAYHREIIGFVFLFAFALVMSLLYIKTRSLLIPIACHITFNLVWSAQAMNYPRHEFNLSEYSEFNWFYLSLLLVSAIWIARFLYINWPRGMTRMPYFAEDTKVASAEVIKRRKKTLYAYGLFMLVGFMILIWQSASPDPPPDFQATEILPTGYHRIICPSGEMYDYPPEEWPFGDLPCAEWPCVPRGYHRIICPSSGVNDYPPGKWPFTEWPCTGWPCF